MKDIHININNDFYFTTALSERDVDSLVNYLNDITIYNNTLKIPKEYTRERGFWYLNFCKEKDEKYGKAMAFQIRTKEGEMIGSIELLGIYDVNSHKEEIGYWLAAPFRGKGLMQKAINTFNEYVFKNYNYVRLEATVFVSNITSQHLLEKCNFNYEGTLKKAYFKDGKYIDAKLYALIKE